jgi:hypothetical protein
MPSQPERPASESGSSAEPGAGDHGRELLPREVDFKAVARVSTQAELEDVRLRFLHADMIERDGPIPRDWTQHVVGGLLAEHNLDRDARRLAVTCGFVAVYAPGVDPDELDVLPAPHDAPVELHARFELTYELKDISAIEDADAEHFALSNGILHAWPYWRELAHSTTTRMGLTPLIVGVVKIPWTGDPAKARQPENAEPTSPAEE